MTFPEQIPADRILKFLDDCRRNLFPTWRLEKQITAYANGDPPPSDGDTAETEIVPLGFAQTRMKNEMAPLLDPLFLEPGIIDGDCVVPAITGDPGRTAYLQTCVPKEINTVVWERLIPILRPAAGRATVTGRAFLYWKSPNDWLPRNGQMVYPIDSSDNVLDANFREWAFMEKLSLRDIDTILKSGIKNERMGWSQEGLEKLKLWIMASESQKYVNRFPQQVAPWGDYNPEGWLGFDLSNSTFCEPVDVYWYFRKNGKITRDDPDYGGHEEVDVYCISRFGNQSSVCEQMKDASTYVCSLSVKNDDGAEWKRMDAEYRRKQNILDPEEKAKVNCNERLLFYSKGLFKSITQCLVCHIDDAAVSGEQVMAQVRGTGRVMMPKLAVLESLMTDLVQGISFGVTPNFNVRPGVSNEYLDQLQRGGSRSGQVYPDGVTLMAKNNSFTGVSQAGQFIQMLDTSIASDSQSASQSTFGGSSADFAAQAAAQLQGQQAMLSRRLQVWLITLDKVAVRVASVLCRAWPQMRKSWPCYEDANRMGMRLMTLHGVQPDEWDSDRWSWKARRLAGGMTRQQSVAVNTQMMQVVGPAMPSLIPVFAKEILRAVYGDTIAEQMTNPGQRQQMDQTRQAQTNVTIAYVTGTVPPVLPMDDPILHSKIAGETAEARIQAAMQAGETTQTEVVGISAILAYAAAHIMRLPQALSKPALQKTEAMLKAIQSVPVTNAQDNQMTPKDQATLELKARGQARLERVDEDKRQQQAFDRNLNMAKLSDSRDMQYQQTLSMGNQRAQGLVKMQTELDETDDFLNEPAIA